MRGEDFEERVWESLGFKGWVVVVGGVGTQGSGRARLPGRLTVDKRVSKNGFQTSIFPRKN